MKYIFHIALIIANIVVCLAYSCHYFTNPSSLYTLTFICEEGTDNSDYFDNGWSTCPGQYGFYKNYIEIINFQDCQMSEIYEKFFTVYMEVHTFDISSVGLKTLKPDDFISHSRKLVTFIATHNQIEELTAHLFNEATRLNHIDLSSNKINQIDSDTFPEENQLQILDLSFNNITSLNVKMFQKLTKLQKLFLKNNQITEIIPFVFHRMEQLNEIDVSFNKIKMIDYFGFSGAVNLKTVYLANNQITTVMKQMFDKRSKIEYLDVSNNLFMTLSADTFEFLSNLQHFDISNNLIEELKSNTFDGVTGLQHLNLSCNSLTEIKSGTFSHQTNLRILDLSNNKLTILNTNILSMSSNQLRILSFAHNHVRELIDFTLDRLPNAIITGIDSNHLSCLHFEHILESFTPDKLGTFSNTINCSNSRSITVKISEFEHSTTTILPNKKMITTTEMEEQMESESGTEMETQTQTTKEAEVKKLELNGDENEQVDKEKTIG